MTPPRWRVTWWQGGPPGTPQAVERRATVSAPSAAEALRQLDAELAAAGAEGHGAVVERAE